MKRIPMFYARSQKTEEDKNLLIAFNEAESSYNSMKTKYTKTRYNSYSKYVRSISAIGGTVLFVLTVIGMFMLANYVNAWEQAHNYPYGKLCELYNNCAK